MTGADRLARDLERKLKADGKRQVTRRDLRIFGIGLGVIFGLVFGTLIPFLKYRTVYLGWWIPGGLGLALGLIAPRALQPIYRVWMVVAGIIGRIVNTTILVALYYTVFLSVGLAFKVLRRDVLKRHYDRAQSSYWEIKEKNDWSIRRYQHPF